MMQNIVNQIAQRANPSDAAVITTRRTYHFADLLAGAESIAGWLRTVVGKCGPGAVPRIGLACPNGPDYIMAALGILRFGACLVPVADELTPPESAELAARTGLCGLLVMENGMPSWQALGSGGNVVDEAAFAAIDPAFIRFSSGTTGASKGVVIGHRRLVERIEAANSGLAIGRDDRVLWMLPMAHHFAVSIVLYLYHGACTVLADSHLAEDVLRTAERSSATVIYGAPFHHALLAADASAFRWPSLRLAVSTAAALPAVTAQRFMSRFGKPLVQGLGIIEIGLPILNQADATDAPEALGRPLPAFNVDLRDITGRSLPPGETGELWINGPGFFDAYLSPWQLSCEICRNGWFATGDLAEIDATGRIFLRGRLKSVLNIGGMKAFPEEIETVIDAHPEVRQSRVSGRDHPVLGSVPFAEVIPREPGSITKADLIAWCRARLAAFKVPTRIHFVDTIPTTASGKIRRT